MQKHRNSGYHILVVDDEPLIRQSLYEILRIEGFRTNMASSGEQAIQLLKTSPADIVLTDLKLPKMSGLELLENIKKDSSDTEIILLTGFGTIETAVDAMKKGAYDYVTKPINDQEIKLIIEKIIQQKEILKENRDLKQRIAEQNPTSFCKLIGSSEKIQKVYQIIDSVASTNATILISGESGTGKGLVADAIHKSDRYRLDKPFVEISCGALSETLLESELFGHMKGAFTGAIKDKEGRFEFAKGGTVFLDEIDAFSPNLQVKLLRVLQDGVFERVGDNKTRHADVRIIVATNRDLHVLTEKGQFREDLYYRVNVINIAIPPLRERKDDVEILAKIFVERFSASNHKKIASISDDVMKLFMDYHWPGNVRELENVIEGAVIMAKTGTIQKSDIPNIHKLIDPGLKSSAGVTTLKQVSQQPEKELILTVLKECDWNRNKAAARLGVNRTTLYNKMRKYDIDFVRRGKS